MDVQTEKHRVRVVLLGTEKVLHCGCVQQLWRTNVYDVAEFDAFTIEALMALIELRRAAYARLLAAEAART